MAVLRWSPGSWPSGRYSSSAARRWSIPPRQRRKAIREADLVILAGVPSDFRLDYGRHVRRSACLISANRSKTVLERSDYHEVAAALGGRGVLLKNQDRVEACVNEARHAAGEGNPVLLNAWLDKTDFREGSLSL